MAALAVIAPRSLSSRPVPASSLVAASTDRIEMGWSDPASSKVNSLGATHENQGWWGPETAGHSPTTPLAPVIEASTAHPFLGHRALCNLDRRWLSSLGAASERAHSALGSRRTREAGRPTPRPASAAGRNTAARPGYRRVRPLSAAVRIFVLQTLIALPCFSIECFGKTT
jgi:hypothetical protein